MTRRVLVGRSVDQAGPLVKSIAEMHLIGVYQPLLKIAPLPLPEDLEQRLGACQAVLITSANAARRLADSTKRRFMPILTVGDGSARVARSLGFVDVKSAGGDVAALVALCRARLQPELGRLLYLRGKTVTVDLVPVLQAEGYEIEGHVVYAAEMMDKFRPPVERALRQASLDVAMLFSPRSAANFVSLVREAGVEYACAGMVLIAISPAVATAASELIWRVQLTAAKPTVPALLETLGQWRDGKFAV